MIVRYSVKLTKRELKLLAALVQSTLDTSDDDSVQMDAARIRRAIVKAAGTTGDRRGFE